jgi:hypothetical protein
MPVLKLSGDLCWLVGLCVEIKKSTGSAVPKLDEIATRGQASRASQDREFWDSIGSAFWNRMVVHPARLERAAFSSAS